MVEWQFGVEKQMKKPDIKKMVDSLGGAFSVSLKCGVRTAAVRMWVYGGYVPYRHRETLKKLAEKNGVSLGPMDYR